MFCCTRIPRTLDFSSSDKTSLFCSNAVLFAFLAYLDFSTSDLKTLFRATQPLASSSSSPQAASSVTAAEAEKTPEFLPLFQSAEHDDNL